MEEKRKVSTDALETLGTIISDGGRDAIHLAVEPVIAGERLKPGEHIGIANGKATSNVAKFLGIVDPFLKTAVKEGEKFWLIVYPRQITSLRHVWSHPDFTDSVIEIGLKNIEEAEVYLRDWIESTDDAPTYEDLLAVGTGGEVSDAGEYGERWSNEGEYLLSRGSDASGDIPSKVWDCVEIVTGKKVTMRPTYFSCTC